MSRCEDLRLRPYRIYLPWLERDVIQWDWLYWANLDPEGPRLKATLKVIEGAIRWAGFHVHYRFEVMGDAHDRVLSAWIVRR